MDIVFLIELIINRAIPRFIENRFTLTLLSTVMDEMGRLYRPGQEKGEEVSKKGEGSLRCRNEPSPVESTF